MLPVASGEISAAGVRQQQEKQFYVSPFVDMAMRYHFRITPPGEHFTPTWSPRETAAIKRLLLLGVAEFRGRLG